MGSINVTVSMSVLWFVILPIWTPPRTPSSSAKRFTNAELNWLKDILRSWLLSLSPQSREAMIIHMLGL